MNPPFVVLPDEGRLLSLGNFEALVMAEGAQTEQSFSLIRRDESHLGSDLRCTATGMPQRRSTSLKART